MRLKPAVTGSRPPVDPRAAAALAGAAFGNADLPLLIVRRSRRMTAFNLLFASLAFGLAVASLWYAWRADEALGGPLMMLVVVALYGVQAGQQFRDETPKVIVERAGLSLPGVTDAPIAWSSIGEIALARGLLGLAGGHVHVAVDAATFQRLKLGIRWLGDPVVKGKGMAPALMILGAPLDTGAKTIFAAMRRHWPPGG